MKKIKNKFFDDLNEESLLRPIKEAKNDKIGKIMVPRLDLGIVGKVENQVIYGENCEGNQRILGRRASLGGFKGVFGGFRGALDDNGRNKRGMRRMSDGSRTMIDLHSGLGRGKNMKISSGFGDDRLKKKQSLKRFQRERSSKQLKREKSSKYLKKKKSSKSIIIQQQEKQSKSNSTIQQQQQKKSSKITLKNSPEKKHFKASYTLPNHKKKRNSPIRRRTFTTDEAIEFKYISPNKKLLPKFTFKNPKSPLLSHSNTQKTLSRISSNKLITPIRQKNPKKNFLNFEKKLPALSPNTFKMTKSLLVNSFKEMIRDFRQVEELRISLSKKIDFSYREFFDFIDFEKVGKIYGDKLFGVMSELGIDVELNDALLLIERYDKDRDAGLSLFEFMDLISPFSSEYRENFPSQKFSIEKKIKYPNKNFSIEKSSSSKSKSKYSNSRKILKISDYCISTKKLLRDIFAISLSNEKNWDFQRELIKKKKDHLFDMMDKENKGVVTMEDLGDLLAEYEFPSTLRELNWVVHRFDWKGDQKISYGEFVAELTPKRYRDAVQKIRGGC